MRYPGIVAVALLVFALEAGLNVAFPETPPANADKPTDGKYYLIWRVTAPKVEVGAPVEVEPAFFTNGEKIVFAWDYCRQRYVREFKPKPIPRFYTYEPRNILAPDYLLDPKKVGEDLRPINHYCDYQDVTLEGARYFLMDNYGVKAKVGQIQFKAPPREKWYTSRFYPPLFPENGTGAFTQIEGAPPSKSPVATDAKQPYGFLMSTNRQFLEHVVPISHASPGQVAQFQARFEKYKLERQQGGGEEPWGHCQAYWPKNFNPKALNKKPINDTPGLAEALYVDVNGDGAPDMVARIYELNRIEHRTGRQYPSGAVTLRDDNVVISTYLSTGDEKCALLATERINYSQLEVPMLLIGTNKCFFSFTQFGKGSIDSGLQLQPLLSKPSQCESLQTYRAYENTN